MVKAKPSKCDEILKSIKRRRLSLSIVAGVCFLFVLPPLINGYIRPLLPNWFTPDWQLLVVKTFSGNWSPDPRPAPISSYWFSVFAEFAIVLNLASFGFLLGLWKRVRNIERNRAVQLKDAFDIWKENAKFEVAQALSADATTADTIDKAIDLSVASLRPLLVAAYGKREVERFFEKNAPD